MNFASSNLFSRLERFSTLDTAVKFFPATILQRFVASLLENVRCEKKNFEYEIFKSNDVDKRMPFPQNLYHFHIEVTDYIRIFARGPIFNFIAFKSSSVVSK